MVHGPAAGLELLESARRRRAHGRPPPARRRPRAPARDGRRSRRRHRALPRRRGADDERAGAELPGQPKPRASPRATVTGLSGLHGQHGLTNCLASSAGTPAYSQRRGEWSHRQNTGPLAFVLSPASRLPLASPRKARCQQLSLRLWSSSFSSCRSGTRLRLNSRLLRVLSSTAFSVNRVLCVVRGYVLSPCPSP